MATEIYAGLWPRKVRVRGWLRGSSASRGPSAAFFKAATLGIPANNRVLGPKYHEYYRIWALETYSGDDMMIVPGRWRKTLRKAHGRLRAIFWSHVPM